jgi:uncharacterized membrane protein YidH (DUF202 family)
MRDHLDVIVGSGHLLNAIGTENWHTQPQKCRERNKRTHTGRAGSGTVCVCVCVCVCVRVRACVYWCTELT